MSSNKEFSDTRIVSDTTETGSCYNNDLTVSFLYSDLYDLYVSHKSYGNDSQYHA